MRIERDGIRALNDMLEGTNAFAAKICAPRIKADTVEVIRREDMLAPALKVYDTFLSRS